MEHSPSITKESKYKTPLTVIELEAFIGLMLLTGVFRVNREPVSNLYCSDPNLARPIFKATLPRDRFKIILRYLRFDDFRTRIPRVINDRLAPIREILELINGSFKESYIPNTFLTVDEHLCKYRGRCPFKQYIPSKPHRYGIKMFIVADSRNFYPNNVEIYTGKSTLSNSPQEIVLRLTAHLPRGHVIMGDNFFTSLKLSNILLDRGIKYFLFEKNRREIPNSSKKLKRNS